MKNLKEAVETILKGLEWFLSGEFNVSEAKDGLAVDYFEREYSGRLGDTGEDVHQGRWTIREETEEQDVLLFLEEIRKHF